MKQCQIVGVDWGGWVRTNPDPSGQTQLLQKLVGLVEAGKLNPPGGQHYALADTPQAMRDLLSRRVTGKAVLIP